MRPRSLLCLALAVPFFAAAREPVRARTAMVVAQEPLAVDAGLKILREGGNAIDAAIAVGFALAVTHPEAGNIGGGGFMLVRMTGGQTAFIDFRETAPRRASRDMYLDASGKPTNDSILGWRAAGVPGTVRGFEYAHKKLGRKNWRDLLAPAVELAAQGFPIPYGLAQSLRPDNRTLSRFPESRRILLNDGRGWEPGGRLIQRELAQTLQRIGAQGARDFYEGETAHRLAAAMQANNGLITLEDLKSYRAVERRPLTGHYKGYEVITAPPPSSGGIGILQMLGMLEGSGYERAGAGSAAGIHFVAETMRRFYADRSEYLADPDFYTVPLQKLLDPAYIEAWRRTIRLDRATPSQAVRPGQFASHESTETTHYNVIDAEGNIAAVTYTLNGGYGNGLVVPGLGFLLNDEMDDFAAKPGFPNMFGLVQGESNAIQPGKRPLSSMTPTLILRGGKPLLVLGAPGGGRIITGVLQVLLNVLDFGMNVQEAVDAPRFHHQWRPDILYLEKGISPDTARLLQAKGHRLELNTSGVGRVEAILIGDGWLQGGHDGRGDGKAAGY